VFLHDAGQRRLGGGVECLARGVALDAAERDAQRSVGIGRLVNFLATCDTTGGNSGSPTIDSQGFDRVWESVANDFGYNPEIARNVNADVRYLLWLLDEVEGATPLLAELKVTR
jgi:hypothetical protein